jgi:hypothetical protein
MRASRVTGVFPMAESPPGRSIPTSSAKSNRQQPTPAAPTALPARFTHRCRGQDLAGDCHLAGGLTVVHTVRIH